MFPESAIHVPQTYLYCRVSRRHSPHNDACTAFARGEAAMYPIGSYATPQILSVNPDLNIDSFVMPASDNKDDRTLNSGIDLGFCIMG